jgi:hypothetical protein
VLLDLLAIRMLSGFSHRPLSYFALLAAPGAAAFLALALGHEWMRVGGGFDEAGVRAALVLASVLAMVVVYFFMLGLLAELVVKASGMHRPGEARVLVKRMERA